MRIGDADRDRVADLLRDATAEGRLDLDELGERLDATFAAKTYGELDPIVADLPGAAPVLREVLPTALPAPEPVPAPRYRGSTAIMAGRDREGVWEVGPTHNVFAMFGGVVLDLREARFTTPEVLITANAVWGGVDIIVNPWTRVQVEGSAVMGDFRQARDRARAQLRPDSPLVRVRGLSVMAGVTVVRKALPGERRRPWYRRG